MIDVSRTFPKVLDLGAGAGHMTVALPLDRIEAVVQLENTRQMLIRDRKEAQYKLDDGADGVPVTKVVGDEEFLPFQPKSFNAVISCLGMHWVNDLPSMFKQVHTTLVQDGMFMGAVFGGDTLFELRCSLQLAEQEVKGGFSPHISPMLGPSDVGGLLQGAGYTLLTVDQDCIVVNYPSPKELMEDLKIMGESNASNTKGEKLSDDVLEANARIYAKEYGNDDGTIPASFDIIYFIGWTPDPTQQKPMKPGSADINLMEFGDVNTV
ncbi:hypothetical protein SARC_04449 [Sphaeroforma arctica JP610]|uniref:Methyltransferase type 11 domain-containing protein n=1 Tax=Sphaeroforma arctica JP610 TaxID=667725 RepID=A0A0L0G4U8_9EUKA|nr:hypothetical protein SARC_04449 [Sphaeroforma arctica JP610]KNC83288.1 hypothetical protein SARC_04449 [Sphaeroforma arctica JP610]|eukprot:XP_014157190.1 hypothetical protein SARC_04449 [Sphaeroforma arctica JP610]